MGEKSEMTLSHDDDILRFVNMYEMHHELGNEGKREAAQLCDTRIQPSLVLEI